MLNCIRPNICSSCPASWMTVSKVKPHVALQENWVTETQTESTSPKWWRPCRECSSEKCVLEASRPSPWPPLDRLTLSFLPHLLFFLLFFYCTYKGVLTWPTLVFSGLRVGLRCLPRLRFLRGHGTQTQTHRGDVHHPSGGHLHRGQSLPSSVPR